MKPAEPINPWNVADAKSRLSEVLNRADTGKPQVITRRDRRYVLITGEDYERLRGERPSLKALILDGPSLEGLDLTRDRSPMRDPGL